MNRIFFHFLVIFSIACSREATLGVADDLSPEMVMGVSAEATSLTRGAVVDEPEDMVSMGVYCAYTDDIKLSSGAKFTKMDNSRFDINTNGEWIIYGDDVCWGYDSLDDYYTFYGYSPYGNETQGISPRIVAEELIVDYVVPESSLNQPDLMFATPRKDINPQLVGNVALYFNHTLASVSFGVSSSVDTKILGVQILGVVNKGSVSWDYDTQTPQWSFGDDDKGDCIVDIVNYTLDGEKGLQITSESGYLMMIPQTLEDGAEVLLTLEGDMTRSLTIPAGTQWEANKRYHYVIDQDDDCDDGGDFIFDSTQISNCYIINPTEGVETVVQIPIETRINDFWKNYKSNGSKKIKNNSTEGLVADMVWTDFEDNKDFYFQQDIFVDDDDEVYVQLKIPAKYQAGNFVFSISKVTETETSTSTDILWSWHLWFTDYNPDALAKAASESGVASNTNCSYTISGYEGVVHRYSGAAWSGIYADKFIMDRNIGERNSYATDYGAGSVYYQFGRKDPFPGDGARYLSGNTSPGQRSYTSASFETSVEFVVDFFMSGTSSAETWCGETESRDSLHIWFDKNIEIDGYVTGKSIFDPSPLGWRVPVCDTWSSYEGAKSSSGVCTQVSQLVGIYRYYEGRGFSCSRDLPSGTPEAGYVWSATPDGEQTGYCLYVSDSEVNPLKSLYFISGLPVRAIQE